MKNFVRKLGTIAMVLVMHVGLLSAQASQISIGYAWYGIDGQNNSASAQLVMNKLNSMIQTYGFIVIPASATAFYGIDPFPGMAKTTAIALTVNGQPGKINGLDPRAPEGTDFVFPLSYVGTQAANNALAAEKAKISAGFSVQGNPNGYAYYSTWNWMLQTPGRGQVSFSAVAQNDITVLISQTIGSTVGTSTRGPVPSYEIVLGGWGNTKSQLRKGPQNQTSLTAGTNWDTAKIPANSASNPAKFVISINQTGNSVTITVNGLVGPDGKTPVTLTYTDMNPIPNAQYISFTAWNTPITYSNIALAPLAITTISTAPVIQTTQTTTNTSTSGTAGTSTAPITTPTTSTGTSVGGKATLGGAPIGLAQ